METGLKVGDLMTRNFVWVKPEVDLRECAKLMVKKRVGSLLVVEKERLRGILTEKDIVWAVVKKSKANLSDVLAKDLMKRKVVTIRPSADITDAVAKLKKKKIRRLPVVEKGKLIGLLTMKDILRIDPGLFEMIAETLKIKEETSKLNRKSIDASRKLGVCEGCGVYDILYDDDQWICESCYNRK